MKVSKIFKVGLAIAIVILAQILMVGRSLLLSNYYGASNELDLFYIALNFSTTVFNIIGVALTTVLVPYFTKLLEKNNKIVLNKALKKYLLIIYILSILLLLIIFVYILFTANGVKNGLNNRFVKIVSILLFSQLIRINIAVYNAILQVKNEYIFTKIANLFTVGLPIISLYFSDSLFLLSSIILIGQLLELLSLYIKQLFTDNKDNERNLNNDFYINNFNSDREYLIKSTTPILISSSIFQLQILIMNYYALGFGEGSVTLYSNINQIISMFNFIVIGTLIQYLFPIISDTIIKDEAKGIDLIHNYSKWLILFSTFCFYSYIYLGKEVVFILFNSEKMPPNNIEIMYIMGIISLASFPISVARDLVYRSIYAIGKNEFASNNAIFTIIINLLLFYLLKDITGIYSIVIAPTIGSLFSYILISFVIRKLFPSYRSLMVLSRIFLYQFIGMISLVICIKINLQIDNIMLLVLCKGIFYFIMFIVVYFGVNKLFTVLKLIIRGEG